MKLEAKELARLNMERSYLAESGTLPGKDIYLLCYEYLVMADILVKLAEFEATPEFMDKVAERVGMGILAWDQVTPTEIGQAVIDQSREELSQ